MSNEENKNKITFSVTVGVIFALNAVIGSGVFAMPLTLLKTSSSLAPFTILLSAFFSLLIGLGFARVIQIFDGKGDFFTYSSAWGGKIIGGLTSLLYIVGLSIALGVLTKSITSIISIYMTTIESSYIAYGILIGIFIATLFASSIARVGQIVLFVLTIVPLVIISVLGFSSFNLERLTDFSLGIKGIFKGLPSALFAFIGFETISTMTQYFKNPRREVPLVTILTIFITAIIYALFVVSIIGGIDNDILFNAKNLSEALLRSFNSLWWIIHFINASIIITILGTVYALFMALQQLTIKAINQTFDNKYTLSDVSSAIFILFASLSCYKIFLNISGDIAFSIVCMCVVSAYLAVILYLLLKPQKKSDLLWGIGAVGSSGALLYAAISQLF